MKKVIVVLTFLVFGLSLPSVSGATNGDSLIGIGPISRAMGGVGVAAPQDGISAVFANPAAMCFGPYCPGSEAVFAGTYFDAKVTGKIDARAMGAPYTISKGTSRMKPFVVPAIAITSPITPKLRFAIGAYGVSGMGVDYKDKGAMFYNSNTKGYLFTKLEIMKFAPNLAYLITPNFSVGVSVSVDYGNLDLGAGGAHDYTVGVQVGALYHWGPINFGISYITPQKFKHEKVSTFGKSPDTNPLEDLELENPQTLIFGVSFEPNSRLLFEFDTRWYNWADAKGYEDFDWDNQWVFALGAQFRPIPGLALRAGFNYGKNPVNKHNGWNPMGSTNVQGVNVNNFNYEVLRVVGFPAIVEKHLTLGIGYDLTDKIVLNVSYMHAFKESMKESSLQLPSGGTVNLESTNKENSVTFGLTWRF